jgi:hypothetical protein
MKYRKLKGYKYQLAESYTHDLPAVFHDEICDTPFLILVNGHLLIKEGYAWDGPSGPTIDTKDFMAGSLVHDALYQLIRTGQLQHKHRKAADQALYAICRQAGMGRIRAWYVYNAVRFFGARSARPRKERFDQIFEV